MYLGHAGNGAQTRVSVHGLIAAVHMSRCGCAGMHRTRAQIYSLIAAACAHGYSAAGARPCTDTSGCARTRCRLHSPQRPRGAALPCILPRLGVGRCPRATPGATSTHPGRAPGLLAGTGGDRAASAAPPVPGSGGCSGDPAEGRGRRGELGGSWGHPLIQGPSRGCPVPTWPPPPRAPGRADFVSGAGSPGEHRAASGAGGRGTPLAWPRPPSRPATLPRAWVRSPRPGPPGPAAPARVKRNQTKSKEIKRNSGGPVPQPPRHGW